MNKRSKVLDERDRQIKTLFRDCLVKGMRVMDAYAYCAEAYGLTEDRIRQIVN